MMQLVKDGVNAVRVFAGFVDREQATKLLPFWSEYDTIGSATRDAILAEFPPAVGREPVPGVDFLPVDDCCDDCDGVLDDEADFADWSAELGVHGAGGAR